MDNLVTLNIPVNAELKKRVEAILAKQGITLEKAIIDFLKYVDTHKKLPFDIPG